jgi:hypothetical protein
MCVYAIIVIVVVSFPSHGIFSGGLRVIIRSGLLEGVLEGVLEGDYGGWGAGSSAQRDESGW